MSASRVGRLVNDGKTLLVYNLGQCAIVPGGVAEAGQLARASTRASSADSEWALTTASQYGQAAAIPATSGW